MYSAPKYTCAHTMPLTSNERKGVISLFHKIDKDHNNKVSTGEFYTLLNAVSAEVGKTHHYNLRTSIYSSVYYTASDTNHDHNIELNEFIAGVTKLKNIDPKDFPEFMKVAASIKTANPKTTRDPWGFFTTKKGGVVHVHG